MVARGCDKLNSQDMAHAVRRDYGWETESRQFVSRLGERNGLRARRLGVPKTAFAHSSAGCSPSVVSSLVSEDSSMEAIMVFKEETSTSSEPKAVIFTLL